MNEPETMRPFTCFLYFKPLSNQILKPSWLEIFFKNCQFWKMVIAFKTMIWASKRIANQKNRKIV